MYTSAITRGIITSIVNIIQTKVKIAKEQQKRKY